MLSIPAPFPEAGSFGLYIDPALPLDRQRAELVRILERGQAVSRVAFPLRAGASGNQRVAFADIIDGTPLSKEESRELVDLQRHLLGRARLTPKMLGQQARADALGKRAIWSGYQQRQIDLLRAAQRIAA